MIHLPAALYAALLIPQFVMPAYEVLPSPCLGRPGCWVFGTTNAVLDGPMQVLADPIQVPQFDRSGNSFVPVYVEGLEDH
jgi:hypothetical protein